MIDLSIGTAMIIGKFNNIIMQKEEKSRDIPGYRDGEKL